MEGSDYDQFKRDRGIGQPSPASSAPSGYATTAQPETSLEVDPRLTGAAPAPEKKGIADTMKDLFGGHEAQNTESSDLSGYPPNQQPVYGDATDDTGTTDTKVGFVDKIKSKVGMGHHEGSAGSGVGHHPDAHPHGTGAPPSHYGTHASTLDPTGPSAGSAFGDHSETFGQPGHLKTDTPYGTDLWYEFSRKYASLGPGNPLLKAGNYHAAVTKYGTGSNESGYARWDDYSRKYASLGPGNPLWKAGNYDAAATKYGTGSNESGSATRTEQMPSSGVGKSSGMNPESSGGVGAPGYEGSAGSGVRHPYGTGAPPSHYDTHASTMDPTGPPAGSAFGDHSETFGQPGHLKTDTPYGTGRWHDFPRKYASLGPGNPLWKARNYDAAATKYGTGSSESGYATRTEQMPYSSGVGKSSGMNPESYGGVGAPGYEARTESSPYGTGAGVGKMSGMNPEGVGANDYIVGGGGAPGYEARTETAPYGRGPQSTNTQNYGVRNMGFNSGSNVNKSGAVHAGWPHPTDPRTVPGGVISCQRAFSVLLP